jgi:hypothetical protein
MSATATATATAATATARNRSVFDLSVEDRRGLVAKVLANIEMLEDGCWRWTGGRDRDGYGLVSLKGQWRVHRVVWEICNEQRIPVGYYILHSCHNSFCCQPAHLRTGSHRDNVDDMVAAGRQAMGEDNGRAVLTATIAGYIKWLRNVEGLRTGEIAAHYGINPSIVSHIAVGRQWAWVEAIEPPWEPLQPAVGIVRRI